MDEQEQQNVVQKEQPTSKSSNLIKALIGLSSIFFIFILVTGYFLWETKSQLTNTSSQLREVEEELLSLEASLVSLVEVVFPADDGQYCLGETIPIIFIASEDTKVINLWRVTGLGSGRFNLGKYRPTLIKDEEPNKYIVNWDQEDASGNLVSPSYTYELLVETVGGEGQSGVFAIVDCN